MSRSAVFNCGSTCICISAAYQNCTHMSTLIYRTLDDPISPKLIDPEVIARILREPEKHNSRAARGLRSHIVLRSRYAEDELREAIFRGLKQFVNLGAGYDTFAY